MNIEENLPRKKGSGGKRANAGARYYLEKTKPFYRRVPESHYGIISKMVDDYLTPLQVKNQNNKT
jgi:peptide subunit release factor 1 (eRF1)